MLKESKQSFLVHHVCHGHTFMSPYAMLHYALKNGPQTMQTVWKFFSSKKDQKKNSDMEMPSRDR